MSAATRALIVREARSWIGTPYAHCADIKGVGVDCGMLLVRVLQDAGVADIPDPRPYSPSWHLHQDGETYLTAALAAGTETSEPAPGDVLLMRVGRCFSHGGVVSATSPLTIIHASFPSKIVLEEEVSRNPQFERRIHSAKFISLFASQK